MQETNNLKLPLYELDDAANLADGYNQAMNILDKYANDNDERFPITSAEIQDGAINTVDIAPGAITNLLLATNAVSIENLQANSVGKEQLTDDAIDWNDIPDATITTDMLKDDSVTNDKLAADSVSIEKISASSFDGMPTENSANLVDSDGIYQFVKMTIEDVKETVSVEDFGAVGDGTTDDTTAFQAAVNSFANGGNVMLTKEYYYIANTVNIPSSVNVLAPMNNEKCPVIYFRSGIGTVFNCIGAQNIIANVVITPIGKTFSDVDSAIVYNGTSAYNVDSKAINVSIMYCGKGIVIKGRNVDTINCLLSHCRYGIYCDIPTEANYLRGLNVQGTRFHGIGEELVNGQTIYNSSAGFFIENDNRSNVTIQNCISDQGAAIFKGHASSVMITDCFVECFVSPAVVIDGGTLAHGNEYGATKISNNCFYGKAGQDSTGTSHANYPVTLVSLNNYGRIDLSDNVISRCSQYPVRMNSIGESAANNNKFIECGGNCAFYIENQKTLISILNNCYMGGDVNTPQLVVTTGTQLVNVLNNSFFSAQQNNSFCTPLRRYYPIQTGTFGTTKLTLGALSEFVIIRTDGVSTFRCSRVNGNYIASSPIFSSDHVDFITWADGVPTLNRLTYATNEVTTIDPSFTVYGV